MSRTIDCPVEAEDAYGSYANSFRVLQDGPDVLLDFCVYSEQDNRARVVSRIRVRSGFLQVILSRLMESAGGMLPGNLIYIMPESKVEH